AEVEVRVDGRDDLACVSFDHARCRRLAYAFAARMLFGGGLHLGVGNQAIDQGLSPRSLPRADSDSQARRQLVDDLVSAARNEPAPGGAEEMVPERPGGKPADQQQKP